MDDKIYDLLNDVKMNDELYHVEELSEIENCLLYTSCVGVLPCCCKCI